MSGTKYLLDTNAIIALLSGNKSIEEILSNADWIGVSVISVLEFFSFPNLSVKDRLLFYTFLARIEIVDLSSSDFTYLENITLHKVESGLKLPDAIIACTAIQKEATLISNDEDFKSINTVSLFRF